MAAIRCDRQSRRSLAEANDLYLVSRHVGYGVVFHSNVFEVRGHLTEQCGVHRWNVIACFIAFFLF